MPIFPPSPPSKPKLSKYVNTPYGPVLRTDLGRGPTFSKETAKQFKPGQVVGTYIDGLTLKPVPIIPNPIKKTNEDGGNTVKTATTSVFTDTFFSALPDYAIDETLSLKNLTGNEILQVSHRENFYTTSEVLNRNVLDIVDSRNFYSPTEIIKLQTPDESYFQNSLDAYTISLASSTVSISIPSYKVAKSYKIQLETFAPREIKNDTIY